MSDRTWRPWEDAGCPECGDDTEVFTSASLDYRAYDGESVRCVGCGFRGCVSVDDDGSGVIWNDEEPAP